MLCNAITPELEGFRDERKFCRDGLESHKDQRSPWVLLVYAKNGKIHSGIQGRVDALKNGSEKKPSISHEADIK